MKPSSGKRQNEVQVHSMIVNSMGSHVVYSFNVNLLADVLNISAIS